PSTFFAHPAALPVANEATDRHFAARLGKREETRLEAGADFLAEELLGEEIQRALQVRKRNVFVNGQPFDLVKHGGVGGIRVIVPVALARDDDIKGRPILLHGADLHRRGVSPQNRFRIDIERVPIVPRRMTLRDVECVEVIVGTLNLRAALNPEAEPQEDVLNFALHPGYGVDGSEWTAQAGKREIPWRWT